MNRTIASRIALAATTAIGATLLLTVARTAHADDITIDPTPFVSSRSRAEVRGEVMNIRRTPAAGPVVQLQPPGQVRTDASTPRAADDAARQARAERRTQVNLARVEIAEMNSEDGGSSYMLKQQRKPRLGR